MSPFLIRALQSIGTALAAVTLLVSCNSSSSDPALIADGSGATTNGGGIGGSGFVDVATGDITGFSSVIINGVIYDTSNAQISVNNMPAAQSDLRVGMTVTAQVNAQSGAARSVTYAPLVLGPVSTVSLATSQFDILGQTVLVDANTVLDEVSLDANSDSVIAAGAVLEVSGIRNANREIVASYIRRANSATSYQLQGLIEAEVNAAQQLLINGLNVDVSGIDPAQFLSANEGDVISLVLSPEAQDATAVAGSAITPIPSINDLLIRFGGTKIRVEGFISNNTLGITFNFDDLQVFPTADTIFKFADGSPASASDLGANSRIELIATTTGVGVVTPDEIIIIER